MAQGIVTEQQSAFLNNVLADLGVQTEADAVYLTDQGGNIVACIAPTGDETIQTIAALAAGSFAATRQLAAMIGERSFTSVFHKGDHSNIFIQCAENDYLVLVIFGRSTALGLVKLYVDNVCRQLQPLLRQMGGQGMSAEKTAPKFEFSGDAQAFKKQ